jgi:hypothetical protein
MLRIPHCLDSRLTDGGWVVSPTHRPHSTPQKDLNVLISVRGWTHPRACNVKKTKNHNMNSRIDLKQRHFQYWNRTVGINTAPAWAVNENRKNIREACMGTIGILAASTVVVCFCAALLCQLDPTVNCLNYRYLGWCLLRAITVLNRAEWLVSWLQGVIKQSAVWNTCMFHSVGVRDRFPWPDEVGVFACWSISLHATPIRNECLGHNVPCGMYLEHIS